MIKKLSKFIFIFICFFAFASFIFLDQVKAEDLQCCYGNLQIDSSPKEDYCEFVSSKPICEDQLKEFTVIDTVIKMNYTNIKKGSCLEGNTKCLRILDDGGVSIKTTKNQYIVEIGENPYIFFTAYTSANKYPMKISLFCDKCSKNGEDFFGINKAPGFFDTPLNGGILDVDGSGIKVGMDHYVNIDILEFVKKNNIKTLPYSFSLIFFGEVLDESAVKKYGVTKVEIEIKPKACGLYLEQNTCDNNPFCIWASGSNVCYSNMVPQTCTKLNTSECSKMSPVCKLDSNGKCNSAIVVDIEDSYGSEVPAGYSGIIPECAFKGNCKDVNQFLNLAINAVRWIFGIVGGLALIMFVYGGLLMIISFGNEEKVKQGKSAIIASVIGLVIVFGAYLLVNFLLTALGVSNTLNILN
jgi:hypothetical protein